jgi:hypothetical protein
MKCEICNKHRAKHTHHIQSKSKGGSNHPGNLCKLCPNCHSEVHEGVIVIEGRFLTTTGYQLIFHKKDEESITCREPEVYIVKSK